MPFILNLVVACLAAFGLSVLFGAAVVWLENEPESNELALSATSSATSRPAAVRVLPTRNNVSGLSTLRGDTDRDRNVA